MGNSINVIATSRAVQENLENVGNLISRKQQTEVKANFLVHIQGTHVLLLPSLLHPIHLAGHGGGASCQVADNTSNHDSILNKRHSSKGFRPPFQTRALQVDERRSFINPISSVSSSVDHPIVLLLPAQRLGDPQTTLELN